MIGCWDLFGERILCDIFYEEKTENYGADSGCCYGKEVDLDAE
jgi:hypothetical protein